MLGLGLSIPEIAVRGGAAAATPAYQQLLTRATAAGAEAVYDPDNPDTWTLRNDGADDFYAVIADGLGNREDWAQGTASNQPKQIELSTGRKAMLADLNDRLVADFASSIAQPNTVLLVGRIVTASAKGWFLDSNTATGPDRQILAANGSAATSGWAVFAGAWLEAGAAVDDVNFHMAHGNYDGASSEVFVDGVSVASGDAGSGGLDGLVHGVGSARTTNIEMGPVLVFTGKKTNAELSDIRNHINANWPIGLSA